MPTQIPPVLGRGLDQEEPITFSTDIMWPHTIAPLTYLSGLADAVQGTFLKPPSQPQPDFAAQATQRGGGLRAGIGDALEGKAKEGAFASEDARQPAEKTVAAADAGVGYPATNSVITKMREAVRSGDKDGLEAARSELAEVFGGPSIRNPLRVALNVMTRGGVSRYADESAGEVMKTILGQELAPYQTIAAASTVPGALEGMQFLPSQRQPLSPTIPSELIQYGELQPGFRATPTQYKAMAAEQPVPGLDVALNPAARLTGPQVTIMDVAAKTGLTPPLSQRAALADIAKTEADTKRLLREPATPSMTDKVLEFTTKLPLEQAAFFEANPQYQGQWGLVPAQEQLGVVQRALSPSASVPALGSTQARQATAEASMAETRAADLPGRLRVERLKLEEELLKVSDTRLYDATTAGARKQLLEDEHALAVSLIQSRKEGAEHLKEVLALSDKRAQLMEQSHRLALAEKDVNLAATHAKNARQEAISGATLLLTQATAIPQLVDSPGFWAQFNRFTASLSGQPYTIKREERPILPDKYEVIPQEPGATPILKLQSLEETKAIIQRLKKDRLVGEK